MGKRRKGERVTGEARTQGTQFAQPVSLGQIRPAREVPTNRMVPYEDSGEVATSASSLSSCRGSQSDTLSSASSTRSPLG
jgi:hypothetical protein